jgi:poly(A) polymerase
MYRLRDNGYKAFLVGGSVRDLLLERTPKDFDLATDATPTEIKKLFRNCRLIGRRFRLAHLHFKDEIIELATFRKGGDPPEDDESAAENEGTEEAPSKELQRKDGHLLKSDDGMLLRDNLFGSPEEDAWRRDFTINALSYNIADFSIIDYVGGVDDLQQKLIRTIGDPATRISEDPVRMLRAIRFSAQLDFSIEHHCWEAMLGHSRRITLASPARLFDEVVKLFLSGAAEKCWRLLHESGLAAAIFPDFVEWLTRTEGAACLQALPWIDKAVRSGRPVSTPLLLALFFGGYLAEKGVGLICRDNSPQTRIDGSLAIFMEEAGGRLFIAKGTIMRLREILLLQQRLVKTPGRKPENVTSRPGFGDALEYLAFTAASDLPLNRIVSWWGHLAAGTGAAAAPPDTLPAGREDGYKGKRRRRRKRKKPAYTEAEV